MGVEGPVLIRGGGFMETQVKVPKSGRLQEPSDRKDAVYTGPFERHSVSSFPTDVV